MRDLDRLAPHVRETARKSRKLERDLVTRVIGADTRERDRPLGFTATWPNNNRSDSFT